MSEQPSASIEASAKLPITVIIPVKNDAEALKSCLACLSSCAHVWVVDSQSADDTCAVAEASRATVLQFIWNGKYPKKRNWVLLNHEIPTPWILFLDADEHVTPAFCAELQRRLGSTACDAFWCHYSNHFMGRELKFGLPQRKLALIRAGAGLYERIEEEGWSCLDMEVHEHPQVAGRVGTIDAKIVHADRQELSKFLVKHVHYAQWEARRFLTREMEDDARKLTSRQKIKYRFLASVGFAPAYFFYVYIVRLGILDGSAGLHYAFYKFWYFVTVRQLIASYRRKEMRKATPSS